MESGKRKRVCDKVGFHEEAKESFFGKFLDGKDRREVFIKGKSVSNNILGYLQKDKKAIQRENGKLKKSDPPD